MGRHGKKVATAMDLKFGEFTLDLARRELRRGGRNVRLQPRVLDLLVYLARNRERVVPKVELFDAVWKRAAVAESALTFAVKEARRSVGDDGGRQRVIETVRGRGYRFIAPVVEGLGRGANATQRGEDPFVGRDALLGILDQEFAKTVTTHGRAVLLTGEPGIGKTRTLTEFSDRARARGARVLMGRCMKGDGVPNYWPWVQVLRSALREHVIDRDADLTPECTATLARSLPNLREDLLVDEKPLEPTGLSEDQVRFRLFDQLVRLTQRVSIREPLVLLIDDLHWADAESLSLLEFFARSLQEASMLIVCAYRDSELDDDAERARMLGRLARVEGTRSVVLDALSVEDVAQYLEKTTGQVADAHVASLVHSRTGGNPFFLTQISDSADAPLSRGAREAVHDHLEGLPEDCRELLSLASVIGRDFEIAVLARVAKLPVDEVLDAIEPAVATRTVRQLRPLRFRFTHGVITEALGESLSASQRSKVQEHTRSRTS